MTSPRSLELRRVAREYITHDRIAEFIDDLEHAIVIFRSSNQVHEKIHPNERRKLVADAKALGRVAELFEKDQDIPELMPGFIRLLRASQSATLSRMKQGGEGLSIADYRREHARSVCAIIARAKGCLPHELRTGRNPEDDQSPTQDLPLFIAAMEYTGIEGPPSSHYNRMREAIRKARDRSEILMTDDEKNRKAKEFWAKLIPSDWDD